MADRAEQAEPDATDAARRLVEGGRHRWHRAPGDEPVYVLDDGTGDVELRIESNVGLIRATLFRRDDEVERFELPSLASGEILEAAQSALDEAVERLAGSTGDGGPGKTRFLIAFGPKQMAALRGLADRERISVAEAVRRAVDGFLADQERAAPKDGDALS